MTNEQKELMFKPLAASVLNLEDVELIQLSEMDAHVRRHCGPLADYLIKVVSSARKIRLENVVLEFPMEDFRRWHDGELAGALIASLRLADCAILESFRDFTGELVKIVGHIAAARLKRQAQAGMN